MQCFIVTKFAKGHRKRQKPFNFHLYNASISYAILLCQIIINQLLVTLVLRHRQTCKKMLAEMPLSTSFQMTTHNKKFAISC